LGADLSGTDGVRRTDSSASRWNSSYSLKEYTELAVLNQMEIPKHTGCPIPCQYYEYKIADKVFKVGETPMLKLIQSSSSVIVKTEKLVYPLSSFITEFGGALGLFLHHGLGCFACGC
jgi:hypothetical protein